jgi:hypothetical protein
MTLAVARFFKVLAIAAFTFGIAEALRPASLLAQTNATIQASATILTPPSSQQTQLATPEGAQSFYAATPALQAAPRTRVADRRGTTMVSAQAIADASASTDQPRPRVRLTIEFAAN